ncbi:MAG: DUF1566 domain-containing protein [Campylobacterota bacterium]|nr:DUF1566 domain-containing protein [Campylobacterota bacterium]
MRLFYFLLFINIHLIADSIYVKSDNVVIDISKNIMWQDNIDVIQYKSGWTLAKEYCNSLTLNGFTDWKLPTIKELQTIANIKKAKPALYDEFKYIEHTSYWSRSQDITNDAYAWYVGFKTGATYKDSKDYDCYVRCVRSRFKK